MMKFNFFNDVNPAYIAVNNNGFLLEGKLHKELECFIRDIIPVRKLFKEKKVECYSNDARKGKTGEYCSLCRKRNECRQRIRLMLLIHEETCETPAMLEINTNSFDTLRKTVESVDENDLSTLMIVMKIETQGKYLKIKFNPVF